MTNTATLIVPQLGEGLHTIIVVDILVSVGQFVARDSPFAEVSTDKATLVIESPYSGLVESIHCSPGDQVAVGAMLAVLTLSDDIANPVDASVPSPDSAAPVRMRRRDQIRNSERRNSSSVRAAHRRSNDPAFPISAKQRILAQQMRDSLNVPTASIETTIDWSELDSLRRLLNAPIPSGLELIAWSVAKSMQNHDQLRAVRVGDDNYIVSEQPILGLAIAQTEDDLRIGAVPCGIHDSFPLFQTRIRDLISDPHRDSRQVSRASLIISDMSSFGVLNAKPIVVSPSVATLFIGSPDWHPYRGKQEQIEWRRTGRIVLAFDHALINAARASAFLADVADHLYDMHVRCSTEIERSGMISR